MEKGTLKKPKCLKKKKNMEFSLKAVQYPACCRWGCSHLALSSFVDGWQEKMALEILQRIHNTQINLPPAKTLPILTQILFIHVHFLKNMMQNMIR